MRCNTGTAGIRPLYPLTTWKALTNLFWLNSGCFPKNIPPICHVQLAVRWENWNLANHVFYSKYILPANQLIIYDLFMSPKRTTICYYCCLIYVPRWGRIWRGIPACGWIWINHGQLISCCLIVCPKENTITDLGETFILTYWSYHEKEFYMFAGTQTWLWGFLVTWEIVSKVLESFVTSPGATFQNTCGL